MQPREIPGSAQLIKHEAQKHNLKLPLFTLSTDVLSLILRIISPNDVMNFAILCSYSYALFINIKWKGFRFGQPRLFDFFNQTKMIISNQKLLLLSVIRRNNILIKSLLRNNPDLIFAQESIREHKDVCALLLAKRRCDVEISRLLLSYAQPETERGKQMLESVRKDNYQKNSLNVSHLRDIAQAMIRHRDSVKAELFRHRKNNQKLTELSHAMDIFRDICDLHGEFTAEDFANVWSVFKEYRKQFDNYGQHTELTLLFFFQIVGYVELKMPLSLRMLIVKSASKSVFDIIKLEEYYAGKSGLGFDFAIDINLCKVEIDKCFQYPTTFSLPMAGEFPRTFGLSKFVLEYQAAFSTLKSLNLIDNSTSQELILSPSKDKSSSCVIC